MRWMSRSALWMLGLIYLAAPYASGLAAEDEILLDYLPNPFAADRPEWDPFGPDPGSQYLPGRPSWDPYTPGIGDIPQLVASNPFSPEESLSLAEELRSPNQLYLQSGPFLVTEGVIGLGSPYTLWLYVGSWGPLSVYDGGRRILYQRFVTRGWYRLDGYAETLEAHRYQFNTSTRSNAVALSVSSAGYPTGYGLVGRVVDVYGNGVPGALVRIAGSGGGTFSTATNAQGYYGMDVPSGTYTVTAETEGFAFNPSTARVWTGTVSAAGTIVGSAAAWSDLPAGSSSKEAGWLEGAVTDKAGAPIPGATVRVDGIFTVTTDQDGAYWAALDPGWHSVVAYAVGYKFSSASVQIIPGQGSRLDIQGTKVVVLGKVA